MKTVKVGFNKPAGKIKPLHGVNNAARMTDYGELLEDFVSLRPPFCRLHDTAGVYGGSRYVDVANIFPDPEADEDDPASYDFTLTDLYIKPLIEMGTEVFYRLGATIEHEPKKYRTVPPADFSKWARVCEHIVRHYNDGWANGFRFGIRYWEIWNEPDGTNPECEPYGCPNWQGSAEEYYRLYELTAKEIKSKHPDVLVGGYSSCYILGSFVNGGWFPGDHSFFTGFLSHVKESGAPLDFFSWHSYLGKQYIEKLEVESEFIDKMLSDFGFKNVSRFNTEWNCNISETGGERKRIENYINYRNEKGASHVAAALYKMQRCKIDAAMYYDAQLWFEYGALFNVPELTPSKAWHALRQFGELYSLGNAVWSTDDVNIYSCAAASADKRLLCIANIGDCEETVSLITDLPQGTRAGIFVLDAEKDLELVYDGTFPESIKMKPFSVVSIKC